MKMILNYIGAICAGASIPLFIASAFNHDLFFLLGVAVVGGVVFAVTSDN